MVFGLKSFGIGIESIRNFLSRRKSKRGGKRGRRSGETRKGGEERCGGRERGSARDGEAGERRCGEGRGWACEGVEGEYEGEKEVEGEKEEIQERVQEQEQHDWKDTRPKSSDSVSASAKSLPGSPCGSLRGSLRRQSAYGIQTAEPDQDDDRDLEAKRKDSELEDGLADELEKEVIPQQHALENKLPKSSDSLSARTKSLRGSPCGFLRGSLSRQTSRRKQTAEPDQDDVQDSEAKWGVPVTVEWPPRMDSATYERVKSEVLEYYLVDGNEYEYEDGGGSGTQLELESEPKEQRNRDGNGDGIAEGLMMSGPFTASTPPSPSPPAPETVSLAETTPNPSRPATPSDTRSTTPVLPGSPGDLGPGNTDGNGNATAFGGTHPLPLKFFASFNLLADRADWPTITCIPHYEFKSVLAQYLHSPEHPCSESDFEFVRESRGGYNYVRIYSVSSGPRAGTYVVKVPSTGSRRSGWCDKDAYMLRNEFALMRYIHEKTACPVPEVIGGDDGMDNELGAPFIIMRAVEGVPADEVWFETVVDEAGEEDYDGENADRPSAERLEIRKTLLKSLAKGMAELGKLEFEAAGKVIFDGETGQPRVDRAWHCVQSPQDPGRWEWACYPPFASSRKYWREGLDATLRITETSSPEDRGASFVLRELVSRPPISYSTSSSSSRLDKESFVLRHADLDFQNILCDSQTGAVTAIIDWQDCIAVPQCVGYSSVPLWLVADWLPDYSLFSAECLHVPWMLEQYREIYSIAMGEAVGLFTGGDVGDARFTEMSGMYQALHYAIYGGTQVGDCRDLARRVLTLVSGGLTGMDVEQFLRRLGLGEWPVGEKFVREMVGDLG